MLDFLAIYGLSAHTHVFFQKTYIARKRMRVTGVRDKNLINIKPIYDEKNLKKISH